MESRTQLYKKVKPFVAIILVQLGHAGMSIIAKLALNKGMNPRVFIAYRYAVATMVIAPFAIFFDRSPSLPFLLNLQDFYSFLQLHVDEKANHINLMLLTGRKGQS